MVPQCFNHRFIHCCSLVSNSASAAGVSATSRWNLLSLAFPTSTVRDSLPLPQLMLPPLIQHSGSPPCTWLKDKQQNKIYYSAVSQR